jgi:predicted O-methyltransferase YrrM
MNLEKAKSIDGWMTDHELEWLASAAIKATRILEIGSYKGRSTRAIYDNTNGIVEIVDPFKGNYYSNDFKELLFTADDNLYRAFLENVKDTNIIVNRMPFRDYQSPFKFDFIFIDGDHHYVEVKHDIEKAIKLLAHGGIISGHDYNDNSWPDVKRIVDRMFGSLIASKGTIWYVGL